MSSFFSIFYSWKLLHLLHGQVLIIINFNPFVRNWQAHHYHSSELTFILGTFCDVSFVAMMYTIYRLMYVKSLALHQNGVYIGLYFKL